MTSLIEIVSYVGKLELLTQPWSVVAITLSSIAAYCTLLYHLGDCLKVPSTATASTFGKRRIRTLLESRKALLLMAEFGIVSLLLLLGRSFMPCSNAHDGISACSLVTFFLTIICPINLALIAMAGLVVEDFIFEFKRQEAELACAAIVAVIYLRYGRKIRGCFRNLSILRGKRFIQFELEDMSVVTIDCGEIKTVFLQSVYGRRRTLRSSLFKEGPKTLFLTFPHREELPDTRFYIKGDLAILKIAKPTTRSRYAIVKSDCVAGLESQTT